jgi:hypothetical protein
LPICSLAKFSENLGLLSAFAKLYIFLNASFLFIFASNFSCEHLPFVDVLLPDKHKQAPYSTAEFITPFQRPILESFDMAGQMGLTSYVNCLVC